MLTPPMGRDTGVVIQTRTSTLRGYLGAVDDAAGVLDAGVLETGALDAGAGPMFKRSFLT